MPKYLVEGAYTDQGTADLIANPEDCLAVVSSAAEALGGSVELLYFAFGDTDVVAIFDMPDDVSMTALAMAASAGGALEEPEDHCPYDQRRRHGGHATGRESRTNDPSSVGWRGSQAPGSDRLLNSHLMSSPAAAARRANRTHCLRVDQSSSFASRCPKSPALPLPLA